MPDLITPMFVYSLPRSGSTLVQRILGAHTQIATTAEPWILLPLAAMSPRGGIRSYSSFSHRVARLAIRDFAERMPAGIVGYHDVLRATALALYRSASDEKARFFLDKTPRYYLIISFIRELFPESPSILLVRNPLDVLASVLNTWGKDRLWLHHALVDLYQGPVLLHEALLAAPERFALLSYERLVSDARSQLMTLCTALSLTFEESMLTDDVTHRIMGTMGDKSANIHKPGVVSDSVGQWREVLATPLRREFARRYLRRLGPEVLATFGVDAEALDAELRDLPVRWKHTVSDAALLAASFAAPAVAATVIRDQWRRRGRFPMVKLD